MQALSLYSFDYTFLSTKSTIDKQITDPATWQAATIIRKYSTFNVSLYTGEYTASWWNRKR